MDGKLLVVGGDRRSQQMAEMLKQDGYQVQTLGMAANEKAEIGEADALLFPYPFAVRHGKIPTLNGLSLAPEDVLDRAKPNATLLAGKGLEPYALAWEVMPKCFRLQKYMQVDAFVRRNAELSAEAAVYEVMQRSDQALSDLKVLITGYGWFGRALAKKLRLLGATVAVAARRAEARALAQLEGMESLAFAELALWLPKADMVVNTVPAQVLDEAELRLLRVDAWLLEMASAPYGFDRELAQTLGLRSALLPGLPAKYAPASAAKALKEAALALLEEGQK